MFCGLVGHYWCFIKGFTHIARPLYDMLGKEVKMDPVQLPLEVQKAVRVLKDKILSASMLVLPDFDKLFLLETDAYKVGLGAILSQKQDDGHYHPIAFRSRSLTPAEKNYHSSKLEFLALKWSVMEHFKEYLAYTPFVVRTDNNPLMYALTTPNFPLEYQKGSDNGAADALSWVPICHNCEMVHSLMEGAIVGTVD